MRWVLEQDGIDWAELSELYRIAPLGEKPPELLREVYTNSRYKCFVYEGAVVVGAGRALADGRDCSYICDVAVHPGQRGRGLGRQLLELAETAARSAGYRSIYLFTHELMTENLALYTRIGYTEYARRERGGATLVFLRKPL